MYNKKLNSWKISSNKLTKKLNYCYIVNYMLYIIEMYILQIMISSCHKNWKKKEKTIITNGMILIFNFIIYLYYFIIFLLICF